MELCQINALSKLRANEYKLWTMTLSREKVYDIRQSNMYVSGDVQQIFEELHTVDNPNSDFSIQFVLPQGNALSLYTVDMGENFQHENRYNGTSIRGTREDIIAKLLENLKKQGYSLRSNAAFLDVDVLATLQTIMEHNTDYYQTDFQYDVERLREAAEDRGGNHNFLWITRKSGTWSFPEQDVYISDTFAANTWMYFGRNNDENVKAFWIELNQVEENDKKIIGNIVEIDYQKHLDYLCTHSFDPAYVEMVFKNPNDVRIFSYKEFQGNYQSISQWYGTVDRVKYYVENQQEFARAVISAHEMFWEASKPMILDDYIKLLEHDRMHDYGFTADDVQRISPLDAQKAVKYGMECFALHKDGTKEMLSDWDSFQNHKGLFGMTVQEIKLLEYFKQECLPLFTSEEMELICDLAIQAGKACNQDNNSLLDRIIYKTELAIGQTENLSLEQNMKFDQEEREDQEELCRES